MYKLILPVIILFYALLAGCSSTVTGPVTKQKYEVNVGCTDNMPRYREEREQVVGERSKRTQVKNTDPECPPGEMLPQDQPSPAGR